MRSRFTRPTFAKHSRRVLAASTGVLAVHLRALLDAGLALAEITRVVSATAPLSARLAQDIEARCNAPVMEIYGSTETGQIASRRPHAKRRMAAASRDKIDR